jgi:hypothetical protein
MAAGRGTEQALKRVVRLAVRYRRLGSFGIESWRASCVGSGGGRGSTGSVWFDERSRARRGTKLTQYLLFFLPGLLRNLGVEVEGRREERAKQKPGERRGSCSVGSVPCAAQSMGGRAPESRYEQSRTECR